jgi:hypothetical protein
MDELLNEKSPPGFKGTVKAMKKHKEIDNPWALAWHMKNKGDKAHYKDKDGKPEKKEKYKKFDEWLSQRDPALYQEFMGSTGAIVGSCKGGPDYQVMGACSDLKKKKKSTKTK